jgi:hypothetical protein
MMSRIARCCAASLPVTVGILAGACSGDPFSLGCTDQLEANLVVEVRDSATGVPAARGAIGIAEHRAGARTELVPTFDSLRLHGSWAREQSGEYTVTVRKPGFRPAFTRTTVEDGGCHVETRTVRVALAREPLSMQVSPLLFTTGSHSGGYGASVGVQTLGDTLVLAGRAWARCTQLTVVAYRTRDELHVQLEPAEWAPPQCSTPVTLQQFETRFLLPPAWTYLSVTDAYGYPAVLFEGAVEPSGE